MSGLRKPVQNVRGVLPRRREAWKKSYKTSKPCDQYAGRVERNEACQWIHHQAVSLQLGPDTKALAYALFDRALFTMKVKRSHVSVLAASCILLASKLYEDEQCRDLSKFLIKQANLTFGKRDLHRMEMLLLSKFDWKIDDATAVDMVFALFDLAAGPNKNGPCYQLKNFIAHFLASQLIDLDLAHIPCLELALGTLQAFNYKSSFKVFSQLKMSKIPFDKKLVDEAVSYLRPRQRRQRIPQSILNADEEDVLPLLSKVFAQGCLVETPFGRKSIADVCAGPSTSAVV